MTNPNIENMKIIVVNISKTIEERGSLKATQRAWKIKT